MVQFNEKASQIWESRDNCDRPSKLVTGEFKAWVIATTSFLDKATIMQRLWHIIHKKDSVPMCPVCNSSELSWRKESAFMRYSETCSSKCANATGKPTASRKRTCQERYNVDHPSQMESTREKVKATNISRYGVANTFQYNIQDRVDAMKHTINSKYDIAEVSSLISEKSTQKEIGQIIGLSQVGTWHLLSRNELSTQKSTQSSHERMLVQFLSEKGIEVVNNSRHLISPHEIDIYIPTHNLAIEINGLFWHGECNGKNKQYHINKTSQCESQGIQLLQFYDFECVSKADIVKSIICSKLGLTDRVFARKTKCQPISNEVAATFLNRTHIQGHVSAKKCLGLFLESRLVAVATFCKSRYAKDAEWELLRFASELNTTVVGGLSKILAQFGRDVGDVSLMSYADRRFSVGHSYKAVGFEDIGVTQPNYHYFSRGATSKLLSRIPFQKHKLSKVLDVFDPELTEWENMKAAGYDRIWDCGSMRLIKNPA